MSILQMFRKKMLAANQLLKAKKTIMIGGQKIFKKGRPYKIVKIIADMMVLKGEAGNTWIFRAKKGATNLIPLRNFGLIGKKAKATG